MVLSEKLQRLTQAIDDFLNENEGETLSQILTSVEIAQTLLAKRLAARVSGPLNSYLAMQSQDTFEDKRSLAIALDRQLKKMGLVICSQVTDEPALVVVKHTADGRGAFAFSSALQSRTDLQIAAFDVLPPFDLIPAPSTQETSARPQTTSKQFLVQR